MSGRAVRRAGRRPRASGARSNRRLPIPAPVRSGPWSLRDRSPPPACQQSVSLRVPALSYYRNARHPGPDHSAGRIEDAPFLDGIAAASQGCMARSPPPRATTRSRRCSGVSMLTYMGQTTKFTCRGPKWHRPSPKLRRVGFRHMTFRGLLGVHSRFGLPVRSINQGDLYSEYFNEFVASFVAMIASGRATDWPDGMCTEITDFHRVRSF